ncbi:MAG: LacI family DNA-binding transcriptional regulator [Elusimicrobiota bacterium]
MSVRMKDIAKTLNVSVSTVSRVLNNVDRGRVREDLRNKILKFAEKNKFRFNYSARALKKGVSNSIGIVCPYDMYLFTSYTSEIIRGVIDVINQRKYELLFLVIPEKSDHVERFHDFCASKSVSGILLQGSLIERERNLDIFKDADIPFVVMNSKCVGKDDTYIDCDNVGGANEAVSHLIKLGHRRILHLRGAMESTNAEERFAGYKKALSEAGIPFRKELIVRGDFIEENAYREVTRLVNENRLDFSAIFAANDGMAIGAMRALKDKGRRLPEDMSIIGFDDIPPAIYVEPALTTISQNLYDVGRTSAEVLIEKIETKDTKSHSTIIPYKFIQRKSTVKI